MIINNKQSKPCIIIDLLFTLFGWAFLVLFLYNFTMRFERKLNFKFLELNLANANSILLITILVVFTSAAALSWWSSYNKRKYGQLKRRSFQPKTSEKELAEYYQVTKDELKHMQENTFIDRN